MYGRYMIFHGKQTCRISRSVARGLRIFIEFILHTQRHFVKVEWLLFTVPFMKTWQLQGVQSEGLSEFDVWRWWNSHVWWNPKFSWWNSHVWWWNIPISQHLGVDESISNWRSPLRQCCSGRFWTLQSGWCRGTRACSSLATTGVSLIGRLPTKDPMKNPYEVTQHQQYPIR